MGKLVLLATSCLLTVVATARTQTVDHPLTLKDGVLPPRLVHQVDPEFPEHLTRKQKKQRRWAVCIAFVVAPDGSTQQFTIAKSADEAFDQQALKAVKQYRFTPATRDGIPVAVQMRIDVTFEQ